MVSFTRKHAGDRIRPDDINEIQVAVEGMPDPGQVAEIESAISRVSTQRYDIREFGDVGTSDDGPTFNAAMTAIGSAGGGILTGPQGTYTFTTGVTHKHNVSVDFPLGTVFDMSGMDDPVDVPVVGGTTAPACWYGAGSVTALPALGANIEQHTTEITFASAPSVSAGDYFLLSNTTDYSFHTERAYYRAGEACRVVSLSSSTVTVSEGVYDAYSTGGDVVAHKMSQFAATISGVHFILPDGMWGLVFDLATLIRFRDVSWEGGNWGMVMFRRCVGITIDNPRGFSPSATDGAGVNYGIALANCQDVTINDPDLQVGRHALTTTGTDYPGKIGAIPNRNIKINGGTLSSSLDTTFGADCHGNVEYIWFNDVTMPKGLHLAGDHAYVNGGLIRSSGLGQAVLINHMLGMDFVLNTRIEATREFSSAGLVVIVQNLELTRSGGEIVIAGTIDAGTYRVASGFSIVVSINSTAATGKGSVRVTAKVIASGTTPNEQLHGLWVRTASGETWRTVRLMGEWHGCGARVEGADEIILDANVVTDAPQYGLRATSPVIHSHNNRVRGSGLAGIYYTCGDATKATGLITVDGDISLDNDAAATSATDNASFLLTNAKDVVYRNITAGDTRSTPNQTRVDSISTVGTLYEGTAVVLGSVTTEKRSGVDVTTPV